MPYELGKVETIIKPDDGGVISADIKVLATVSLHRGPTIIAEVDPRIAGEIEEDDHVIVDLPLIPSPNESRPQPKIVKIIKDEKLVNRVKAEIEKEPETMVPPVIPGQPTTPPPEDMFG
ncbi:MULTISPECIES: hypothetical protein [unclassified Methanopyrus]|uniref:hypothetical protein n=1 Tax=unclassified Methanopyrus TaxID=2684913 RepID=UPI000B4AC564|nr:MULTISPECIES: hypothetical protein [unclassified Methanopyrus]